MKKSIIVFCIAFAGITLMAFSYINWTHDTPIMSVESFDEDDFVYNIDSRFIATITKADLHNAKSIVDIYPEKATELLEAYQEVEVSILQGDGEVHTSEKGTGDKLNDAQLDLLSLADYSTNIHVSAYCKKGNIYNADLEDYHIVYSMTITPENDAKYKSGYDELIKYLKENSKNEIAGIKQSELQPGKACFTITNTGAIENVKLVSTSGFKALDESMLELLSSIPGDWYSASDLLGQKVDQELIFFFGKQGC